MSNLVVPRRIDSQVVGGKGRGSYNGVREGGVRLPRTGLLFYAKAPGMIDSIGVTLSLAQYNAFWLGDPATGDFRINPSATCTWADGTVSTFFADGITPLTAAGCQEYYDWATGQVVAGPPTEWPDAYLPLTRAQIVDHLSV